MPPIAELSSGQEPSISTKIAVLAYKQGGGRIHREPGRTIFYIRDSMVGKITKKEGSSIFYCPPMIVEALSRKDLKFH
jgi:hypothetical protein